MLEKEMELYLEILIPDRLESVKEIEHFAEEHDVPIMEKIGIDFLLFLLTMQKPAKILEIGAAIGYSAIRMALKLEEAQIVTVELNEDRYNTALQNIEKFGLSDRIHILLGDGLELEDKIEPYGPFDVVFIDAAKAQYKRFFSIYEQMLSPNGLIITDNVLFKGFVAKEQSELSSRNVRQLARKIDTYNKWLYSHPNFETTIIPIGDGIAISRLK
ncbi:O-methyltransferase [Metabacillus fastidiosus]|uniref:O-methyltransferase n=1 Tax=Metabacillus fastidiosus TaxID=1458 RepID=UPI002E20804D|nr:O-methyltransferase [Metabacillus fastidiosus]